MHDGSKFRILWWRFEDKIRVWNEGGKIWITHPNSHELLEKFDGRLVNHMPRLYIRKVSCNKKQTNK